GSHKTGSRSASSSTMPSERRVARRPLALALIVFSIAGPGPAAAAGGVAIVKSGDIAPFDEATEAIAGTLRHDPLQPEILTFDLQSERENATEVRRLLRSMSPSVIVTVGSLATAVMLDDDWSVPIVFSMVLYPAQSGFVSHGTRGVTGASLDVP